MPEDEEQLQQPTNGPSAAIGFNLPESLIAVLPSDPFEQLDLARKITSIALATRLTKLEDEIDGLRHGVADRDDLIADLRARIESLDSTLGELSGQLTRAQEEKESLLNENATLSDTVKKLNRDVSKLNHSGREHSSGNIEEDAVCVIAGPVSVGIAMELQWASLYGKPVGNCALDVVKEALELLIMTLKGLKHVLAKLIDGEGWIWQVIVEY